MKFLRIAVIAGLAALISYKYFTADPPGYCAAQDRYISDEEFIRISEAALAWGMKEQLKTQMRWATENPGKPFSEQHGNANSTLESFERWRVDIDANRKRPGFAKVDRGETRTVFRWLIGYQQLSVTLNANTTSLDASAQTYIFDICGDALEAQGHLPEPP